MRPIIYLVGLAVALAIAGCAGPESEAPADQGKVWAAGNLNNLYVAVPAVESGDAGFRYRERDGRGMWHEEKFGQGVPAAVTAWREHLLVFFASGRYGLFGLENPVVQPSPVAAWMPVAVCEDGLGVDGFGWSAAGEPIRARQENGQWTWRRVEAAVERDRMLDPCAVRFGGRLFIVWWEEVPTLRGTPPNYHVRFLYEGKDRWYGPVTSRLRVASSPHVAAGEGRMVCLFQKPSAGQEPARWMLATYATADEDWHETGPVEGVMPSGPLTLARQGEAFFVVAANQGRPVAAPLDVGTSRVGAFVPPAGGEGGEPPSPVNLLSMVLWGLVFLVGAILLSRRFQLGRDRQSVASPPEGEGLVLAPLWRRAAALGVDYLLIAFVLTPVVVYLAPDLLQRFWQGDLVPRREMLLVEAIRLGVVVLYFSAAETFSGQTLGKRWMGIEVRSESGGKVGVRQAVVRNVLRLVDELPWMYLIGLISILIGRKSQRVGDRLARTVVVRRPAAPASNGV